MQRSIFLLLALLLPMFIPGCTDSSAPDRISDMLENGFTVPPNASRPDVMWWWLNSFISEAGITRDLEEMKKQGIGGALIFDAAPVDRWKPKDVEPAPVGPPFLSDRWRQLFRHAIREADRLDIELGVSITSGFNAGGPWVTPAYGQQEIVWSEMIIDPDSRQPVRLPLPSGAIYGEQGELLKYNEMEVNNDLNLDADGNPVHYRDIAVLAVPLENRISTAAEIPDIKNSAGRIENWALKSVHSFSYPEDRGFDFDAVYKTISDIPGEPKIDRNSIIDVSEYLDANSLLNWPVRQGKWLILRFGHTHTGIRLQATNPHNEGLAMNHLSREAAERQFDEIARKMLDDKHAVNGRNPVYFYLDSWEVRIANWTEDFRAEFRRRRGYDMTSYLPVLTGIIVENREISSRFLHDYRMTIGDCIADNYYGAFSRLAHENDMQYRAEMATTPIPVDMLKCLGRVDVPFGEYWMETDLPQGRKAPWERKFGKQAASAAHIYGRPFAAAEALTVIQKHWEHSPYDLKKTVDQALCSGLNRLMIHTFTHSPPETRAPGYEYFAGTHFNPQITWWDQAHGFTGYISRSQFLLQQGHFVADVCYYQGDQIPAFVPYKHGQPGLGSGYDYDIINTEALLTRLSVENSWLVLPDGMHYRLLVLPEADRINPAVLEKIAELVEAGATVLGKRPEKAFGLSDYPANDSLVVRLGEKLWGDCEGTSTGVRKYGGGRMICGRTPQEILIGDGILPDFEYRIREGDAEIDYIHRRVARDDDEADIYFVINSNDTWAEIEGTFRITDRRPELWDPAAGKIREQNIFSRDGRRITMPLRLAPHGSVFVIFRKPLPVTAVEQIVRDAGDGRAMTAKSVQGIPQIDVRMLNTDKLSAEIWQSGDYHIRLTGGAEVRTGPVNVLPPIQITGPWKIFFQPGRGAPDSTVFDRLISWSDSEVEGIRYFSGTAEYQNKFIIQPEDFDAHLRYYLDLGDVKDLAEITVNGKVFPVMWKPPFRVDVTPSLKSGKNNLSVKITNLWPNRLIGDQRRPLDQRIGFTNIARFTRDTPLLESGLPGPVQIYRVSEQILNY